MKDKIDIQILHNNLVRFMPANKIEHFLITLIIKKCVITGELVNHLLSGTIYDGRCMIIYSPNGFQHINEIFNDIFGANYFAQDIQIMKEFMPKNNDHRTFRYENCNIVGFTTYTKAREPVALHDYLMTLKVTYFANYFDGLAAHCYYPKYFDESFAYIYDKPGFYYPVDIYYSEFSPKLKLQRTWNISNIEIIQSRADVNHKVPVVAAPSGISISNE